jgi:hypothetical protein
MPGESPNLCAVSVDHVDIPVTSHKAREGYLLAVWRPGRVSIIAWLGGGLGQPHSVGVDSEDVRVAGAVPYKGYLAILVREDRLR